MQMGGGGGGVGVGGGGGGEGGGGGWGGSVYTLSTCISFMLFGRLFNKMHSFIYVIV